MGRKAMEWVKRYLPSHILSAILVISTSWLVFKLSGNRIVAVYAAIVAGYVGYEGLLLTRDVLSSMKRHKKAHRRYTFVSFMKNVRNLVIELGPSDVLDSLLISPACLYFFPLLVGNYVIGTIIGKYAADIIFYIPTIFMYEWRKKHLEE